MKKPFKFPGRMIAEEALPLHYEKLYENVFTAEECKSIVEKYKDDSLYNDGLVGNGKEYVLQPAMRLVRVMDVTEDMEPWLYEKTVALVKEANDTLFGFDLYGLWDDFVLGAYHSDNGEAGCSHFVWHSDVGGGTSIYRKLSLIIALSHPDDYQGGEFQVFNAGIKNYGRLPQGSVMIFPSYIPHRVTPVIFGSRHVLINFVLGPRFK